jgi:hypothetical protein
VEVVLEIHVEGQWKRVGSVAEFLPGGSISSEEPDGRQVYIFGWVAGDGPAVWRSTGGFDVENPAIREISSVGLDRLADLHQGPFELQWWRHGKAIAVRFRVV